MRETNFVSDGTDEIYLSERVTVAFETLVLVSIAITYAPGGGGGGASPGGGGGGGSSTPGGGGGGAPPVGGG